MASAQATPSQESDQCKHQFRRSYPRHTPNYNQITAFCWETCDYKKRTTSIFNDFMYLVFPEQTRRESFNGVSVFHRPVFCHTKPFSFRKPPNRVPNALLAKCLSMKLPAWVKVPEHIHKTQKSPLSTAVNIVVVFMHAYQHSKSHAQTVFEDLRLGCVERKRNQVPVKVILDQVDVGQRPWQSGEGAECAPYVWTQRWTRRLPTWPHKPRFTHQSSSKRMRPKRTTRATWRERDNPEHIVNELLYQ